MSRFGLVVEALDDTAGNGLLGAEVIEQDRPVLGEGGGDPLERLESEARHSLAPGVQGLARPGRLS
jgi:hypothetical protein